jgi:hypothetical protein
MAREHIDSLPLYPEERSCKAPSAQRIFELFSPLSRHRLRRAGRLVEVFEPQLTKLQKRLLHLIGIPVAAFRSPR